jgi:two-component system, NarL family, nitrate/nitrite response regulator NarL
MRLVLCDENRILCEALAAALEARGHQVAAIAPTPTDGLAAVAAHRPDVAVMDVCSTAATEGPRQDGAEALGAATVMRQHYPATAVLVLSSAAGPATRSAAMKIGVSGFLRKDKSVSELASALEVVARGGVVAEPGPSAGRARRRARRRPYPLPVLTPREAEVLRRIVAGQNTVQMAGEMDIAVSTLRTYVKNVLTKLGAHSRLQAAALASRENLLTELPA